ncbi:MAG: hypothetical protein JWQ02_2968 [Capsulimonas sp.]|nr:hypothetical protein [Capsulimonas sp.]
MRSRTLRSTLTVLTICTAAAGAAHASITIIGPSAPVPATPGTGLQGFYYGNGIAPGNLANAQAYISTHAPLATFTATTINYSQNDDVTLTTFLGGDAASLSNPAVGANDLTGQIIEFKGFYAVPTAGLQTIGIGSDDGSQMFINGTEVVNLDGDHAFTTGFQTIDFTTAGLYQIDIIYFEDFGSTGISLIDGAGNPVDTDLLYSQAPNAVPEPSSVFAIVLGMFAISALSLRRRKLRLQ